MFLRKSLPALIAFVCGTVVVLEYFLKIPGLASVSQSIMRWRSIIAIFALGLGAVNIVRVHATNLSRGGEKRVYSGLLLATFAITILSGVLAGQTSKPYTFIFDFINVPTGSAIFSLLAFYISTAAYRAFRAKNLEAAVLLLTGCIVMLGKVPIGAKILPVAPQWTDWIMNVLNVGGQRGVMIAGAIGVIAMSFRIIIGLERRSYGAE